MKVLENQLDARISYYNCPLCGSSNISESVVGDCSKHQLYHPKTPPLMQWMNCGDCQQQFINGYLTDETTDLIFNETPDYLKVGGHIENNRHVAAKIVEKVVPYKSKGIWSDIGFGNGSLLFTSTEYRFEQVGVDLKKGKCFNYATISNQSTL